MTIEVGILIAIISAIIAVSGFFVARMKDAEERGALKQRVSDLEKRQDKMDAKLDAVLVKLDEIGKAIARLFAERRISQHEGE